MQRLCASFAIVALALSMLSAAWAQPADKPTSSATFSRAVGAACRSFSNYDRDGDGLREIDTLKPLLFERGSGRGAVVAFVEDRIWDHEKDSPLPDLRPALRRWARDVARDGEHVALIESAVSKSGPHRDGLIVLALRDVLRAVYARTPDLHAAVLIGNYPTASMVRQYYWTRDDGLALLVGTPAERRWQAVRNVRSVAEPVAMPADIVLADLDGHWDQAYRQGPERLAGLLAAFPDDEKREVTSSYQYTAERYEDFFIVQDGMWQELPAPDGKRRFVFPGEPNTETTDADRSQVNILSRPEIAIGRINARNAALVPNPAIKGIHNEGLLSAEGVPQAVEFADEKSVPTNERVWAHSPALERRLLIEYFERNHRFRTGAFADGRSPASFTTEWGSSVPEMIAAVPAWRGRKPDGIDVHNAGATIADFVAWMKRPALLRAIKAHAGPTGFGFSAPKDAQETERLAGSPAWWWTRQGKRLVPGLAPLGGWVNYGLIRTLYENRKLPEAPSLLLHTGCEVIQPAGYDREPYYSLSHGAFQIAESMVMVSNGLALVGRGKVFYDEPREFWKVLGSGGTFGDAWRRYFEVEGADAELAKDGIGRKRAYFWSTLGDCTLRLPADLLKAADPSEAPPKG